MVSLEVTLQSVIIAPTFCKHFALARQAHQMSALHSATRCKHSSLDYRTVDRHKLSLSDNNKISQQSGITPVIAGQTDLVCRTRAQAAFYRTYFCYVSLCCIQYAPFDILLHWLCPLEHLHPYARCPEIDGLVVAP